MKKKMTETDKPPKDSAAKEVTKATKATPKKASTKKETPTKRNNNAETTKKTQTTEKNKSKTDLPPKDNAAEEAAVKAGKDAKAKAKNTEKDLPALESQLLNEEDPPLPSSS